MMMGDNAPPIHMADFGLSSDGESIKGDKGAPTDTPLGATPIAIGGKFHPPPAKARATSKAKAARKSVRDQIDNDKIDKIAKGKIDKERRDARRPSRRNNGKRSRTRRNRSRSRGRTSRVCSAP